MTFQLNLAQQPSDTEELEQAVALAAGADVAVVVVGTTEEVESEGLTATPWPCRPPGTSWSGRSPPSTRARSSSTPALVLLPWIDEVQAVLVAWFPGQEFGNALADVLLGEREPGGRLPTVWPAAEHGHLPSTRPVDGRLVYEESIHVGNGAYDRAGARPAFCFGHGLGYTTWEYLDVTASPMDPDGDAVVTVRVRNTGTRPGREVVQVYASRPDSAVERPTLAGRLRHRHRQPRPGGHGGRDGAGPQPHPLGWRVPRLDHRARQLHLAVGRSYGDQRLVTEIAVE